MCNISTVYGTMFISGSRVLCALSEALMAPPWFLRAAGSEDQFHPGSTRRHMVVRDITEVRAEGIDREYPTLE
jgi:hypothetical protein